MTSVPAPVPHQPSIERSGVQQVCMLATAHLGFRLPPEVHVEGGQLVVKFSSPLAAVAAEEALLAEGLDVQLLQRRVEEVDAVRITGWSVDGLQHRFARAQATSRRLAIATKDGAIDAIELWMSRRADGLGEDAARLVVEEDVSDWAEKVLAAPPASGTSFSWSTDIAGLVAAVAVEEAVARALEKDYIPAVVSAIDSLIRHRDGEPPMPESIARVQAVADVGTRARDIRDDIDHGPAPRLTVGIRIGDFGLGDDAQPLWAGAPARSHSKSPGPER